MFADSNVLIEALLLPLSAAFIVAEIVARGTFDLATCQLCMEDTEDAIVNKLRYKEAELDEAIERWEQFKTDVRIVVFEDPSAFIVKRTYDKYMPTMRHKADIPVLAAALTMQPQPFAILSGNRDHFNDLVSKKCGIPILSCTEFIGAFVKSDS